LAKALGGGCRRKNTEGVFEKRYPSVFFFEKLISSWFKNFK
jgi:uncharacterized protein Veg